MPYQQVICYASSPLALVCHAWAQGALTDVQITSRLYKCHHFVLLCDYDDLKQLSSLLTQNQITLSPTDTYV